MKGRTSSRKLATISGRRNSIPSASTPAASSARTSAPLHGHFRTVEPELLMSWDRYAVSQQLEVGNGGGVSGPATKPDLTRWLDVNRVQNTAFEGLSQAEGGHARTLAWIGRGRHDFLTGGARLDIRRAHRCAESRLDRAAPARSGRTPTRPLDPGARGRRRHGALPRLLRGVSQAVLVRRRMGPTEGSPADRRLALSRRDLRGKLRAGLQGNVALPHRGGPGKLSDLACCAVGHPRSECAAHGHGAPAGRSAPGRHRPCAWLGWASRQQHPDAWLDGAMVAGAVPELLPARGASIHSNRRTAGARAYGILVTRSRVVGQQPFIFSGRALGLRHCVDLRSSGRDPDIACAHSRSGLGCRSASNYGDL